MLTGSFYFAGNARKPLAESAISPVASLKLVKKRQKEGRCSSDVADI